MFIQKFSMFVFAVTVAISCRGEVPTLDVLGEVGELRPGLLEGYLHGKPVLNSAAFLPAPPSAGSARKWMAIYTQRTPMYTQCIRHTLSGHAVVYTPLPMRPPYAAMRPHTPQCADHAAGYAGIHAAYADLGCMRRHTQNVYAVA